MKIFELKKKKMIKMILLEKIFEFKKKLKIRFWRKFFEFEKEFNKI